MTRPEPRPDTSFKTALGDLFSENAPAPGNVADRPIRPRFSRLRAGLVRLLRREPEEIALPPHVADGDRLF